MNRRYVDGFYTPVPPYQVAIADHLTKAVFKWTYTQHTGFIKETEALGSSSATRRIRHLGGKETWIIVGSYHMTFIADPDTRIITVVAARPCLHRPGECQA